jgi:hypothetical protein
VADNWRHRPRDTNPTGALRRQPLHRPCLRSGCRVRRCLSGQRRSAVEKEPFLGQARHAAIGGVQPVPCQSAQTTARSPPGSLMVAVRCPDHPRQLTIQRQFHRAQWVSTRRYATPRPMPNGQYPRWRPTGGAAAAGTPSWHPLHLASAAQKRYPTAAIEARRTRRAGDRFLLLARTRAAKAHFRR